MIKWKTINPNVGPIYYEGKLGKIKIAIVRKSMNPKSYWMYLCSLPGSLDPYKSGECFTPDEGFAMIDKAVTHWLELTGLKKDTK